MLRKNWQKEIQIDGANNSAIPNALSIYNDYNMPVSRRNNERYQNVPNLKSLLALPNSCEKEQL